MGGWCETFDEPFFADLVRGAGSILLVHDVEGRLRFINQRGLDFFGLGGASQIRDTSVFDDLLAGRGDEIRRELDDLRQRPESTLLRALECPRGDGLLALVAWSWRALVDGRQVDPPAAEFVAVGTDISACGIPDASDQRSFQELAANLEQCVWVKDEQTTRTGRMSYVSPAFTRVFGVAPEAFFGQPDRLFDLVHPEDLERFKNEIGAQFEKQYDVEYRIVRPSDGAVRWIWSRAASIRDSTGRIVKLVGISEDITQRKEAEQRIHSLNQELKRMYAREQQLSRTDELTGLGNRHRFIEEADRLWKMAMREAASTGRPSPLAAILLDIDHFKRINDSHGHSAGDSCLRVIGEVLRATVREIDVSTRLGGDEFIVLLPRTSLEEAARVAERIRTSLKRRPVRHLDESGVRRPIQLGASFGVAVIDGRDTSASPDGLYAEADRALYLAKEAGRGTVATTGR